MAFTYASTNIDSSSLSWVRFRVGDTSSGDALLQDAEINALVTEAGNKQKAAALAAESIGAYYARRVDRTIGKLRIAMNQASEHYFALAKRLRAEQSRSVAGYAGGLSEAEKETDRADTDLAQPAFRVAQFDYTGFEDSTE